MNRNPKPLSSCCEKPAKVNMARAEDCTRFYFCTHCGDPCDLSQRRTPFKGTTLSPTRKPSGEKEVFLKVWARCKGRSEVSGEPLLPVDHPMWHWQFSHLLPKGSYPGDQLDEHNIVACTVDEHTIEWPLVKEKTDAEIKAMGMSKWIAKVTLFRALRLKYNQRLSAQIAGRA